MKTPLIKKLMMPELIQAAEILTKSGKLAISKDNLIYLDIDDAYIHHLFPFFAPMNVQKPEYFGEGLVGAHITVMYPEENLGIQQRDLNQVHYFSIKNIAMAELGLKHYYVLLIEAPSLLALRKGYGLPDLLNFKGYGIEFHITLAKKNII